MRTIPDALAPMAAYNQFILWTTFTRDDRIIKLPVDYRTGRAFPKGGGWQQDPNAWTSAEIALQAAGVFGPDYGVGFFFTENDPFFFVDIDKCLLPTNDWSPLAKNVMSWFPGAAVEISQSGKGLHIFGQCAVSVAHNKKNTPLGLELYTKKRFVALTGNNMTGSAAVDFSTNLPAYVAAYHPPKGAEEGAAWTTEAREDWTGPEDDDKLLEKALAVKGGAGSIFGNKATFADIWHADEDVLATSYPDPSRNDGCPYDRNAVDMALSQHLAFWTGNNCERILRLMKLSGLVRDKWEREDYLIMTIENSVAMQESVYNVPDAADVEPILKLKGSDKQKAYAHGLVAAIMAQCTPEQSKALLGLRGNALNAKFWIDNQGLAPADIIAVVTPVSAAAPITTSSEPIIKQGYQFLGVSEQLEHFKGCMYVQDVHRVLTPAGSLLKQDQFNAVYGGYSFQFEPDASGKTTKRAWDAFVESQAIRFPQAQSTIFRPDLPAGELVIEENRALVNTFVPINTPRLHGDVTPFLNHLAKVLPDARDREILLSFMAAVIQYPGEKFQWAPLLQGTEGNGKTLFSRCVAAAVGERYTHWPAANEIAEKYNSWVFDNIFIGIEDICVPDHKKEILSVLLPMITNDRLAKRAMQTDQVMHWNCSKFMFNANPRDAIQKTKKDRRYCVFFTAQQDEEDIERDGMGGNYFPELYKWLKKAGGYAMVAQYLEDYAIPEEFNPATVCMRAPTTSTTHEVLEASMGGVEQEVQEAIAEGRVGFSGGWVSSMAVDRLLHDLKAARIIPPNKRRDMLKSLGYDWHPALKGGRVNNVVPMDGGKPRLFIKQDHISANLTTPAEVVRAYEDAQKQQPGTGQAARIFGEK